MSSLTRVRWTPRGFQRLLVLLGPALHALFMLVLMFAMQRLKLAILSQRWAVGALVSIASVLLIAFLEIGFSKYFEGHGRLTRRVKIGAVLRVGVWLYFYYWIAEKPALAPPDEDDVFIRTELNPLNVVYRIKYALSGSVVLAALSGAACLSFYFLVSFRHRALRIVSVVILPAGLLGLNLLAHYHQFIPHSDAGIGRQQGLEIVFSPTTVREAELQKVWTYPRGIYVDMDRRKVYASFGASLGEDIHDKANFWQIDLDTLEYRTISMCQLRVFTQDDSDPYVYAAPWHTTKVLGISKGDFAVVEEYDYSEKRILPFTPQSILKRGDDLFVAGDLSDVMFKYDLILKRVARVLDFKEGMGGELGGHCCPIMEFSEPSGTIVVGVGLGSHVMQVEPDDLTVVNHIVLPDVLAVYPSNVGRAGRFMVSSMYTGNVWQVDPGGQFRKLAHLPIMNKTVYDENRDAVYVLDYFGGKVLVVDRLSGRQLHAYFVGGRPYSMYRAGESLYALSTNGIVKMDLAAAWRLVK